MLWWACMSLSNWHLGKARSKGTHRVCSCSYSLPSMHGSITTTSSRSAYGVDWAKLSSSLSTFPGSQQGHALAATQGPTTMAELGSTSHRADSGTRIVLRTLANIEIRDSPSLSLR